MDHQVVQDYSGGDSSSSIKVFVRGRPSEDKDASEAVYKLFTDPKKIQITDPSKGPEYGDHIFSYEEIFWAESAQSEIYDTVVKPHVQHVMDGYNSCCFAYGQTGSGKTYSMFGDEGDNRGMIPRVVESITEQLNMKNAAGAECAMVVSFLEIYCDQIRDLGKAYLDQINGVDTVGELNNKTSEIFERLQLERQSSFNRPRTVSRNESVGSTGEAGMSKNNSAQSLAQNDYHTMHYEIHEDLEHNVFVKDLALIPVTTTEEAMSVINMGLALRATHETKINEVSSRSHTVFTINVVQRDRHSAEAVKGMLNLVDLAGSERIKKSESSGMRLKEALHINTSLTALGKVVLALDPSNGISHVPYRDSKLTRLLQNSLGGNSYTTLLATIHPIPNYADESLSTLQFANRCRNVQNTPQVNYASKPDKHGGSGEHGKKMRGEIELLKKKLQASESAASLAANPNDRVLEVLRQMGIEGTIQQDGTILLPDGRVVGSAMAAPPGGIGGGAGAISASSLPRGAEMDQMLDGASAELQELVADLNHQAKLMKTKLKQRKEECEKLKGQITENQHQHAALVVSMKRSNQQLSNELSSKTQKLEDLQRIMKETHGQQIDELVNHNQTLLQQQHAVMSSIPQSLMFNTKLLQDAQKVNEKITLEERVKFAKELKALEFGRQAEIQNMKQQYEFWLDKKHSEAKKFVADFNLYREKKNAVIAALEGEIVTLYEYGHGVKEVIEGIGQGRYEMRKTRRGLVPMVSSMPRDILEDGVTLGNTLKIVGKMKEAETHRRLVQNRATMALQGVEEIMEKGGVMTGDPAKALRDTNRNFKRQKERPSTSPRMRGGPVGGEEQEDIWNAPPKAQHAFDDDLMTVTSVNTKASRMSSIGVNEEDLDLNTPIDGMTEVELKEGLEQLRTFVGSNFNKVVQARVMRELEGSETVGYIRQLEEDKATYQAQLRSQSLKLKNMRIAIDAEKRRRSKEEKMRGGRPASGRPASARLGRSGLK